MSNLIDFKHYKALQRLREQARAYRLRIERMDKAGLLVELMNYHELHRRQLDDLSVSIRAEQLMEVLKARAELEDLRELAQEFQEKLRARLKRQLA